MNETLGYIIFRICEPQTQTKSCILIFMKTDICRKCNFAFPTINTYMFKIIKYDYK